MILLKSSQKTAKAHQAKQFLKSITFGKVAALVIIALLYFNYDLLGYGKDFNLPSVYSNLSQIPGNILRGVAANPDQIIIDIKHKDFQKLAYKRQQAVEKGLLFSSSDDFVAAKIRYGKQTLKAKVRLKGDMLDHLGDEKWSYRIKLRGENTLFGMKQFSIQHPKTRGFLDEWFMHQAAKLEGLLSLRFSFINVIVNGKELGLFALEEHIDKRLVENNQRRNGPVIKFDESNWWAERLHFLQTATGRHPIMDEHPQGIGAYHSLAIDSFQTSKIFADPVLNNNFLMAHELLSQFRLEKLASHQVFDVKQMAAFIAINDLFGHSHGLHTNQFRFYYNPISSKLEPIPFDIGFIDKLRVLAGTFEEINPWLSDSKGLFLSHLFNDMEMWEAYIQALDKMSEPAYLDELLAASNPQMQRALNEIHSEFPFYIFNESQLRKNQAYIKNLLKPELAAIAYHHSDQAGSISLEVGNIQSLPIEVVGLSSSGTLFKPKANKRIILPRKHLSTAVEFQLLSFDVPANTKLDLENTKIQYRVLGLEQIIESGITPWQRNNVAFADNAFLREGTDISAVEFLEINEQSAQIFFKAGQWTISSTLVIPKGYEVFAGSGVELDLINSALLLSYSPIKFIGTSKKPVYIHSSDNTGQGLMVAEAGDKSMLDYVKFSNLDHPNHGGWSTSGSVTFFNSPVDIRHTLFKENHSEDALNIILSNFQITESIFDSTHSDAFDADFANGSISNSRFINSGNDAIDVSGSVISLNEVIINKAGDKGLSAGEGSTMNCANISINNTEIAVASKDLSNIEISNLTLTDNTIGFAVYQKKSEFGPASVSITGIKDNSKEKLYLVEPRSSLTINRAAVEPNKSKVKELLYGAQYGKKTKR